MEQFLHSNFWFLFWGLIIIIILYFPATYIRANNISEFEEKDNAD